ncbi:MAG TPA: HD domain-containing protein, partial [Longimicrobiales bacterium]
LGLAYLVYPGAVHTRFDHALGVYHLARRSLQVLSDRGDTARLDPLDCRLTPLAALLHDIGHYPFSHAVEELEEGRLPGHHEAVVGLFLTDPDVREALESVTPDAAAGIEALVRGRSASPLQGLVSGSLDLDKIEYLKRDARFCGVPYGDVDVDRLLDGLRLLEDPATGRLEVGVHEKGLAALESLLFAKYQMFRNVYWHHAVRAATAMYKRVVDDALAVGLLDPGELVGQTDEALLSLLEQRAAGRCEGDEVADEAGARRVAQRVGALRTRRLPKRAAEIVSAELGDAGPGDWLGIDSTLKRRLEDRLAQELGLGDGDVYLDYPEKRAMFGLNLLLLRRSGEVLRLGPGGRAGLIGLPSVAESLYRSARVLRLFTWPERRVVAAEQLADIVALTPTEVEKRLDEGAAILS